MPRRCAIGCTPTKGVLHTFSNPKKLPAQFEAWVRVVCGTDECDFNYKEKRVCDRHFTERDRNRNNRLNALAVPSLFLRGEPEDSCSILLEHSYCQLSMGHHKIKGWKSMPSVETASKFRIYQRSVKNLRRQIYRLRNRGKGLQSRFQNAKKI